MQACFLCVCCFFQPPCWSSYVRDTHMRCRLCCTGVLTTKFGREDMWVQQRCKALQLPRYAMLCHAMLGHLLLCKCQLAAAACNQWWLLLVGRSAGASAVMPPIRQPGVVLCDTGSSSSSSSCCRDSHCMCVVHGGCLSRSAVAQLLQSLSLAPASAMQATRVCSSSCTVGC
jgi:hypothetical protein